MWDCHLGATHGVRNLLARGRMRVPATMRLRSDHLSVAWPGKLNLTPARRSHYDEKNNNDFRKGIFAVAWTA